MLTGVVEVGLFCHMAQAAYFGNQVGTHYFSGNAILNLFPGRKCHRQRAGRRPCCREKRFACLNFSTPLIPRRRFEFAGRVL